MLLRSNNLTFFPAMMLALGALSPAANAGMILTAQVYNTPGLPGFQTYDVTASSLEGFVNGFDFFGSVSENSGPHYGITGPLYQGGGEDIYAAYQKNRLFGGGSGGRADTRWLVDNRTGLQIGASQSTEALHAAFTFRGTSTQRDSLRNLPFVRLVTNDPSAVRLNGEFVVNQFWSDGTPVGRDLFSVDTLLSDISVASAPKINTFPDVPAEVIAERERVVAEKEARQLQLEQDRLRQAKARLESEALQAAEAAKLAAELFELQEAIRQSPLETSILRVTGNEGLFTEAGSLTSEQQLKRIEEKNPGSTATGLVLEGTIDIPGWFLPLNQGSLITTGLLRGGLIDTTDLFLPEIILTLDVDFGRLVDPIAFSTGGLQLAPSAAVPEPSAILLLGMAGLLAGPWGRGRPSSHVS